jgi:hypothetical protein
MQQLVYERSYGLPGFYIYLKDGFVTSVQSSR